MADERPLVVVGVAAAAAVLGVERVLELGQRLRGVLDPEVDDALAAALVRVAAEVGDQRVVGVEDETGPADPLGDGLRPLVGQDLDLAVAVELVAEEVAEHDQGRVELRRDLRQPGLVDLEQPLASLLLEQRGRDPPGHVRAGPVVDRRAPLGLEHGGDHPGGGRLAVGGADQGDAATEPGAEAGDRVGSEAQQDPSRQRRATAAAARPAGGADRARRRPLGAEDGAHLSPRNGAGARSR